MQAWQYFDAEHWRDEGEEKLADQERLRTINVETGTLSSTAIKRWDPTNKQGPINIARWVKEREQN